MKFLRTFPQLYIFTMIIQQNQFIGRNPGQQSFHPRCCPQFSIMIKHPCHLQPHGIGVSSSQRFIHIRRYLCQIFGFPARRIHLVKRVHTINMVCPEHLFLFFQETLLNLCKKRFFGIQEMTAIRIAETRPFPQILNIGIGVNPFQGSRHMTCKSGQYRRHVQFTLTSQNLFLQLGLRFQPLHG